MILELIASGLWLVPFSAYRRGIVVALPRKADVKNASKRVADLLGIALGGEVIGYKFRGKRDLYVPV